MKSKLMHACACATVLMSAHGECHAADQNATISQTRDSLAKDTRWTALTVHAAPATGRSGLLHSGSSARDVDAYVPAAAAKLNGPSHTLAGLASYYWQGQKTATGEVFDKRALTAAHKTLPFGTKVRVTRVDTGESVVVRINDRGPFKPGRVIDLSERAAEEIRMTGHGIMPVKLEVLGK